MRISAVKSNIPIWVGIYFRIKLYIGSIISESHFGRKRIQKRVSQERMISKNMIYQRSSKNITILKIIIFIGKD